MNPNTGEVSDECPWREESSLDGGRSIASLDSSIISDLDGESLDEMSLGCGSLVYDSKELDEMFSILDSPVKK